MQPGTRQSFGVLSTVCSGKKLSARESVHPHTGRSHTPNPSENVAVGSKLVARESMQPP